MECRMHQIIPIRKVIHAGLLFILLMLLPGRVFAASQLTAIDFYGIQDPNRIEIRSNGPVTFDKQDHLKDRQVVIELKNATLPSSLSRKIDTSSFDSQVLLISPYQVEGEADTVRVVIQLRSAAQVTVVQEGNVVRGSISTKAGAASTEIDELSSNNSAQSDSLGKVKTVDADQVEEDDDSEGAQRLKTFVNNRKAKNFKGKPITLQVRDVEAADVFRLIGDASGFNIILTDDVKGKLTLSLMDVPWDEALDVVLKILGLTAERNKNILRIVSVKNYTQEKIDEFRATQAASAAQPRVTRIFPISYATLDDLAQIIGKMQSSLTNGLNSADPVSSSSASSSNIISDKRTNSLIIRDTPENMERIKKLIEVLDTQTPQVLIEGKVVEVSESFSKQLAGNLGIGPSANTFFSFAGGNPLDPLVGGTGSPFANGSAIATQSASSGGGGTVGLGFLPGMSRLNAVLNFGESENKLKLIATPRVVVLNKESATITQGTPTILQTTTYQNGLPIITQNTQTANLTLNATPTVTNDGNIRLQLSLQRDMVANLSSGSAVAPRNLTTNVVVESGTTLVLGGIYTISDDKTESGFPLFRKIPILGTLFGRESSSSTRNELIFFITPQILNPKKAGFVGGTSG